LEGGQLRRSFRDRSGALPSFGLSLIVKRAPHPVERHEHEEWKKKSLQQQRDNREM
jgi:hypothetical protein